MLCGAGASQKAQHHQDTPSGIPAFLAAARKATQQLHDARGALQHWTQTQPQLSTDAPVLHHADGASLMPSSGGLQKDAPLVAVPAFEVFAFPARSAQPADISAAWSSVHRLPANAKGFSLGGWHAHKVSAWTLTLVLNAAESPGPQKIQG